MAALLLASAALNGCGAEGEPSASGRLPQAGKELVGNPDYGVEITNAHAERAKTWIYGSFPLCLNDATKAGSVRLTGVALLGANGLELVDAGVKELKPDQDGVGAWPGPLPSGYRPLAGLDFGTRCKRRDLAADVALELRRTGAGSGSMSGFAILYRTDAGVRTVRYRAVITLCIDNKLKACSEAA